MIFHDWIIIEPNSSSGVLKTADDSVSVGVVKEFGEGYYADNGTFIRQIPLKIGDRVLFTQNLTFEVDGQKVYCIRGRDVIKVIV